MGKQYKRLELRTYGDMFHATGPLEGETSMLCMTLTTGILFTEEMTLFFSILRFNFF